MHRVTAALQAAGSEERALKVGDRAQIFTLLNQGHSEILTAVQVAMIAALPCSALPDSVLTCPTPVDVCCLRFHRQRTNLPRRARSSDFRRTKGAFC